MLALGLASVGLYGVIAYAARQRTREIGVRVAFGATNRDVLRLILAQGMVLAGIGVLLGLGSALAATRLARSFLVGVSPLDLLTFASVPLVLLAVAAIASYLPARRASAIHTVQALRDE